jgi:Flp pilus assembly protein TadG
MNPGRRRAEAGQALIEFALAAAIFFMTILGLVSFGIAVFRYNLVADLAQEGARWASVRGSGHDTLVSAASESDVQTYVQGRALGLSVTVHVYTVNSSKTCTATTVDPSALSEGTGFCVKVTNTFTLLTRYVPGGSMTLQSTAEMVMVR